MPRLYGASYLTRDVSQLESVQRHAAQWSVVADGILPAIRGVSPQKHVLMNLSGLLFITEDLSLLFA